MEVAYSFARAVGHSLKFAYGVRWIMEGAHRVPVHGPAILASNHISYVDPLLMAYLADRRGRKVCFLAKSELFRNPILGSVLRNSGQIPVERGTREAGTSLKHAVEALRQGEIVGIFPEGTTSHSFNPMPAKTGVARLAQLSGVYVLPVGIWGSHRIWNRAGDRYHWRLPVSLVVGEPVYVLPDEKVGEATRRIMDQICISIAQARRIYPDQDHNAWWWRDPEEALAQVKQDI